MTTKLYETRTGVQMVSAANGIADDYSTRVEICGRADHVIIWTPAEAIDLAVALLKWARKVKRRRLAT